LRLHWNEYLSEMSGTAILLFFGTSAIVMNFGDSSPIKPLISDQNARHLLTGMLFAGTASLVAISPFGKLSGGHLNPSLTLSFWLLKMMHHRDLIGYVIFQFVGGVLGSVLAMIAWGREFWSVSGGLTLPGPGFSVLQAFAAETVMTFILMALILCMLSRHNTLRLTPLIVWILITFEVLLGASISGTSLNPARSFGPAVVVYEWQALWIYFIAPTLGALLAVAAYRGKIFGNLELKTAKLFHTDSYECIFLNCKGPHRIRVRAS